MEGDPEIDGEAGPASAADLSTASPGRTVLMAIGQVIGRHFRMT